MILKAILVTLTAVCAAVGAEESFPAIVKAYARVIGAGSGALLAYILRPMGMKDSEQSKEPSEQ